MPKARIPGIPNQLVEGLNSTKTLFNNKVIAIKDDEITLERGLNLKNDYTIIAIVAHDLIENLDRKSVKWKSYSTLYSETEKRVIEKPLIGLLPKENTLINNIF